MSAHRGAEHDGTPPPSSICWSRQSASLWLEPRQPRPHRPHQGSDRSQACGKAPSPSLTTAEVACCDAAPAVVGFHMTAWRSKPICRAGTALRDPGSTSLPYSILCCILTLVPVPAVSRYDRHSRCAKPPRDQRLFDGRKPDRARRQQGGRIITEKRSVIRIGAAAASVACACSSAAKCWASSCGAKMLRTSATNVGSSFAKSGTPQHRRIEQLLGDQVVQHRLQAVSRPDRPGSLAPPAPCWSSPAQPSTAATHRHGQTCEMLRFLWLSAPCPLPCPFINGRTGLPGRFAG